jgi:ABC-2 type transport system permease protein
MVAELRFLMALVATNLKSSFALRGAFWLQAGFMVANNVLYFVFWWIFFARFEEVRGWKVTDISAMYGIVAFAFGAAVVFVGGVREMSRRVANGELDGYLTLPKSPLLHLVASRTSASGWGDMASGAIFIAASGMVSWRSVPLALIAVAASAVTFVATAVILHSLAFWLGRMESVARQAWDFLITFSIYPRPLFGGMLKALLFTLLPAAFIGWLPYELLRNFQWTGLLAATGGAAAYMTLAVFVFAMGLRRYESGNGFQVRL